MRYTGSSWSSMVVDQASSGKPHRMRHLLLILFLLAFSLPARAADRPRWIVITAPAFKDAAAELAQHRTADGMEVTLLTTTDFLTPAELQKGDAAKLRAQIAAACRGTQDSFVLLLGTPLPGPDAPKIGVPMGTGSQLRMLRQPTDNPLGQVDKVPNDPTGLLPSVALGRLPVKTAAEAAAAVKRIIAYDQAAAAGKVPLAAALLVADPGGNTVSERILAGIAVTGSFQLMAQRVNPMWALSAVVQVDGSPFCLPVGGAGGMRQTVNKLINPGFIVFAGHSSSDAMYSDRDVMMSREDWSAVDAGQTIFVSCGCWTCQYADSATQKGEGYGVAAIRNPRGPVAVIGATGESYAAAGQLAFDGMLTEFERPGFPARLGGLYAAVKRGIAEAPMNALMFRMLDASDGTSGQVPLAEQRKEHLEMWTLLGDPAMRLSAVREEITWKLPADKLIAGQLVTVRGTLPKGAGKLRVTVERVLCDPPLGLVPVPASGAQRDAALVKNWATANRVLLLEAPTTVVAEEFEARFTLPADLPWERVVLRAQAGEGPAAAKGVRVVGVVKAKPR